MRIIRFFVVMILLTLLGGLVGGASGYMLGAAVPRQLTLQGGAGTGFSSSSATAPDAAGNLSVRAHTDISPAIAGGFVGASVGLMSGVGLGLLVAVFDQIVLAISESKTSASPKPIGLRS